MNALLKRVTRKLACVVLASLIIGCTAPAGTEKTSKAYAATGVEQGTVSTVQGDGFKVEFRVESAWDGHCTMNVVLTNTGESAMKNWALSYEQSGEITQIWNAEIKEKTANEYTIKSMDWNQGIAPGASVNFGYIIQGDNLVLPTGVKYVGEYVVVTETTPLQGKTLTVQGDDFEVTFTVESVWEKHCTINATVKNTGIRKMVDWSFAYAQKGEIIQIWNANIAEQNGNSYVIENLEWNQEIPVGGSINFGYTVQGEDIEIPSVVIYTGEYESIEVTNTPTPVPTSTPTPEPTNTPTPVPTSTPTPEPTNTPTPVPTSTPTPSPTSTPTPVPTSTPTPVPTSTPTPVPTSTPTPSPTSTPTPMPTSTPTPVPTVTPVPSEEEINLEVSAESHYEVLLQWDSSDVAKSYEVLVDGTVVGCVSGSSFSYVLPDKYQEYTYQVSNIEDETKVSNKVSFTNIKKVSGIIEENTTFGENVGSYYVPDSLVVAEDVTLYVKPGTIIRFASDAFLQIDGTVILDGEENENIVLTAESGHWQGIVIGESGTLNARFAKVFYVKGSGWENSPKEKTPECKVAIDISGKAYIANCEILGRNYSYLDVGIAVNATGMLELVDSEIREACFSVWIENQDNLCKIDNSNIEAVRTAIYIKQGGEAALWVNNNNLSNNTSSQATVVINSVGMGEVNFENNEIFSKKYPIEVNLNGLENDKIHTNLWTNSTFSEEEYYNYILLYGNVDGDVTLTKGAYLIENDLIIEKEGKLTVSAGAELYCKYTYIQVYGQLIFNGTKEVPAVLTGWDSTSISGLVIYEGGVLEAKNAYLGRFEYSKSYHGTSRQGSYGAIGVMGKAKFESCTIESKYTWLFCVIEKGELNVRECEVTGTYMLVSGHLTEGNVEFIKNTIAFDESVVELELSDTATVLFDNNKIEIKWGSGPEFVFYGDKNNVVSFVNNSIYEHYSSDYTFQIENVGEVIFSGNVLDGGVSYEGKILLISPNLVQFFENFSEKNQCINYECGTRIDISSEEITQDVVLGEGEFCIGDKYIAEGATLTINAGSKVYLYDKIAGQGTLHIAGENSKEIEISGYRNKDLIEISLQDTKNFFADYMNLNGDLLVSGDGLIVKNSKVNGDFEYELCAGDGLIEGCEIGSSTTLCNIRNSGSGELVIRNCTFSGTGIVNDGIGSIKIENCTFEGDNSSLYVEGKNIEITSCIMSNRSEYGVELNAERIVFHNNQIIGEGYVGVAVYIDYVNEELLSELKNNIYSGQLLGDTIALYGCVSKDTSVTIPRDSYVLGRIDIEGELVVEPGTILLCGQWIRVYRGGSLLARGEEGAPIVFTSLYNPAYGGIEDAKGISPWYGMDVYEGYDESEPGKFEGEYVTLSYASNNEIYGKLTLRNSIISNCRSCAFYVDTETAPEITYCDFFNNNVAIKNVRTDVVVSATNNYWNSLLGPMRYEEVQEEDGSITEKWVGCGDKIEGAVDWSDFVGSRLLESAKFEESKGVNVATGNYSRVEMDLSYDCLEDTIDFVRTYSVQRTDQDGVFGKGWTFSYACKVYTDEKLNVTIVQLPDGSEDSFEGNDALRQSTSTRNKLYRMTGNVYVLVTPEQMQYKYNASGYLCEIQDKYGNVLKIELDASGRPKKVIDYVGRVTEMAYSGNRLTSITDCSGRTISYKYNDYNQLEEVVWENGKSVKYIYSEKVAKGDGIVEVIENGVTTEEIQYEQKDGRYRVSYMTDVNGNTTRYSYNKKDGETVITNSDGTTTKQYYDSLYNILGVIDGCEYTNYYSYYLDENNESKYGEIKMHRDELGCLTTYEWSEDGNITKITHSGGGTEIFDYDDQNHCIYYKDQVGVVTRYIYSQGMLVKEIVELDSETAYSEDADSKKFAITKYTYYEKGKGNCNVTGLLKTVTSPEGITTTYTYDAYGNPKTVTDGEGNTVTYEYDILGRLKKQTSALGYETSYEYDIAGNLEATILDNGDTVKTEYNLQGLPVKEIPAEEGASHAYEYLYNAAGNVVKITNPRGYVTEYEYDIFGNVKTEKLPNGCIYHYTYDANNRVKTVKVQENENEAIRVLKEYEYTRLVGKMQVEETVYSEDGLEDTTTYYYDNEDRLLEQVNPDGGRVTYKYRPDGLLERETDVMLQSSYYAYDAQKNCVGLWTPGSSGKMTYLGKVYNRDGKLLEERQGLVAVTNGQIPSEYISLLYMHDKVGRVKTVLDGNGTATLYEYDKDGRCVSEEIRISPTQKALTKYTYNHLSTPISKTVYTEAVTFGEGKDGFAELITKYTYDKNGRLKTEEAPDGTITNYTYNAMNNCIRIEIKDKSGNSKNEYKDYDAFGNVTREVDSRGNATYYYYDAFGNPEKMVDAMGGVTLYDYDQIGNCLAESSPEVYEKDKSVYEIPHLEYEYDAMGRLTRVYEVLQEANENVRTEVAYYNYNKNGTLEYEKEANRDRVRYTYTPDGKVLTIRTNETEEVGKRFTIRYTYDTLGRVIKEETALGGVTEYTYDAADNVTSVKVGEACTTYEYDGAGNMLCEKYENGEEIHYTYNTLGMCLTSSRTGVDNMEAYSEQYYYDYAGQLTLTKNSMGKVVSTTYDGFGNIIKKSVDCDGSGEYRAEKYTYDANGNVITYTDAKNSTTTYEYDNLNRVISESVTVSGKEQTKYTEYDANGNVSAETDVYGNTTTYWYDSFNRLTSVVSPNGIVQVRYIYDAAGNCISMKDALNNETSYWYNSAGRVSQIEDPSGNWSTTTYDALGNVVETRDGNYESTMYEYDKFGRLRFVTTSDGTVTEYKYDARGNLQEQIDGEGNVTRYTYNALNLPITKTEGETVVATYRYNGDGSVRSVTDAAGNTTTYEYNIHGEVISETVTDAGGNESTYAYEYDQVGNLISVTDESGKTTYTYDELGRVLSKKAPNFTKVTYEYDLRSGMEEGWHYVLQNDGAGTTRTVYDTLNREVKVTTENLLGGTGGKESVEISYYDNGAREQVRYGDGSTETYTFQANGLVKSVINRDPEGTIIDSFSYTYDRAGNMIAKTETTNGVGRGTTYYQYDEQNRLSVVNDPEGNITTYLYDGAGNRKSETISLKADNSKTINDYNYNERNQLLSITTSVNGVVVAKTEYSYDKNGNQLTEKKTVYVEGTDYGDKGTTLVSSNTYDLRNQLIRSETEDAVITNTYNAAGYRVEKTVVKDGESSETYFLYDGGTVIMESDENGVTAKNTYAGPLLLRTVYGDAGSKNYQYMYNAHGDVVTLRSDGEIAATYYYDAFGNVLSKTGEADNSILYAGYQYDEETGLYYVNARMYDPVTARFLQADTYLGNLNDPLSLNLYTYCLNNPDRYVDPSGHSAVLTILGFVAARVIIGLAAGIVSAGMEVFNQKVLEKRTRVNYDLVLFEGISNGIIAMTTSAVAAIGKNAAKQTAKVTARKIGRKLLQGVALGAAEGMAMDVGRQIIEGTKIKDVSFTQALGSGVTGGIFGAAGVGMEFGLDALKKTRGFVKLQSKAKTTISKGANAIKVKFAELAGGNNRGTLNWNAFKKDTVTEALEEAVEGGSNSRNILNVGAGDNPIPCATNIDINPSAAGVIFGDANDLSQFASGQFDHVIALNPYNYNLLDSDVPRVLKEGGIMSVTGNYSNKYFKSIYNASPESLKQVGFEVVSRGDAGSAFLKYGGKVTGGVRQIQGTHLQIILRKVGVQ